MWRDPPPRGDVTCRCGEFPHLGANQRGESKSCGNKFGGNVSSNIHDYQTWLQLAFRSVRKQTLVCFQPEDSAWVRLGERSFHGAIRYIFTLRVSPMRWKTWTFSTVPPVSVYVRDLADISVWCVRGEKLTPIASSLSHTLLSSHICILLCVHLLSGSVCPAERGQSDFGE